MTLLSFHYHQNAFVTVALLFISIIVIVIVGGKMSIVCVFERPTDQATDRLLRSYRSLPI